MKVARPAFLLLRMLTLIIPMFLIHMPAKVGRWQIQGVFIGETFMYLGNLGGQIRSPSYNINVTLPRMESGVGNSYLLSPRHPSPFFPFDNPLVFSPMFPLRNWVTGLVVGRFMDRSGVQWILLHSELSTVCNISVEGERTKNTVFLSD